MNKGVFQANAVTEVNGARIKMLADNITRKVRVTTVLLEERATVDDEIFDFDDPADISAAFAKYSNAVTWAVTRDMHEKVTSGM